MHDINVEVLVTKVGSGEIRDENTGEVRQWAKVYALDTSLNDSSMFTGFQEVEYPLVDEAGKSNVLLAGKIKQAFRDNRNGLPLLFSCKAQLHIAQKKTTLKIFEAELAKASKANSKFAPEALKTA